jgi:hypothetical protein
MPTLYRQIGYAIRTRQEAAGSGGKVIDRLATNLRAEFPDTTGLSRANLHSTRSFADAWPAHAIVQQHVGRLRWGQIMDLPAKLDDRAVRCPCAAAADACGRTRDVLANLIMNRTRERPGAVPSNRARRLQASDSDLAPKFAKSP